MAVKAGNDWRRVEAAKRCARFVAMREGGMTVKQIAVETGLTRGRIYAILNAKNAPDHP